MSERKRMNQDKKRKLQSTILIIAREIKRICDKNDIPYFITAGTLLGAVRHKGFIPWDDDFDIAMKRKDYKRFLVVCEHDLDKEKFFLQNGSTEPKYAFAFTKIQLKGTVFTEDFSKNADIKHGIFVDIFPYDNLPDNKWNRKFLLWKNHILKNLIWIKCGYGEQHHKKKLSYKVLAVLGCLFPLQFLKNKREKLLQKYNSKESINCFSGDYPEEVLCNEWFLESIPYSFEQDIFNGYRDADSFLKELYGNYMKLPPLEQRTVHSKYDIDFGEY